MARKVNYADIPFQREGVLYRGNFQHNLEMQFLRAKVNDEKPVYQGGVTKPNEKNITFVTPSLGSALSYCGYWLEQRCNRSLESDSAVYSLLRAFTVYPFIMAIDAKKYRDKLFWPDQGEGFYIKEGIAMEDITPVFCLGTDRTEDFFPQISEYGDIEKDIKLTRGHKGMLDWEIKNAGVSKKSFLERYKSGEIDQNQLRGHLFGARFVPTARDMTEEDAKISQAVNELEVLLSGGIQR